jgi:hypothetical protein
MNPFVKKYLQKQIFKQKGVIGSAKSIEFAYNALEARMKNLGLDINLIKSERDLNQALGFVTNMENQIFAKKFGDTLKKTDAEIIPITNPEKRLDPKKPILGGTQDEKDMLQKSIDKNVKAATEKGDFVGIKNQLLRDPEIAEEFSRLKAAEKLQRERDLTKKLIPDRDIIPYQGQEIQKMTGPEKQKYLITDDKQTAELLKRGYTFDDIIYAQDNYGLTAKEIMEEAKGATKEDPFPFATGGRAGFRVGKKVVEKLVKPKKTLKSIEETGMIDISDPEVAAEFAKYMKQMDPNLDAKMQQIANDINQRIELRNLKKEKGRKENSEGGRIGFKVGSPSKRAFLKIMGGLAATVAAIKSGLIGTPKKEVAKQVIKETAKDVGSAPPSYFFDLANKIKLLGKESKVKPKERTNEYNYKGKDGSEYTLTEDIGTGEMQIVKEKGGIRVADDKAFDTIEDQTVMEYKPGKSMADESTEGIPADQYDEYRVNFDVDGTPADADEISEIVKKQIIEEASEIPEKKIKRAGGGVAYMLGE